MKAKYSVILLLFTIVLSCLFTSCGKDRWELYKPITAHALWIDSVMRVNYLWNDEMQDDDDLTSAYFLNSVAFLAKVKYSSDQVSFVDTACSVPIYEYGYQLSAMQVSDTAMMAIITYIKPSSVVASAGLQRGEWIMAVDDQLITSETMDLLTDGEAHELTIGHYATLSIYDEDLQEEVEQEVIIYDRMVSLPKPTGYYVDELPVVKVINDKVGYMLYNNIAESNQQKVASASQSLSASGISDMVLDLRYAATGDVNGFQYLASIMAPASALGGVLATAQYAESRHMDGAINFLTSNELQNGVNLNLNTLYVLTSTSTAGPAEMLINCLKTVMNVVVVGQQTKGIGVACETFDDTVSDQRLYLAACHITDANNNADYVGTGFNPDYSANPLSPVSGIQPFGDPDENLLSTALEVINNE